jgi:hypothetical protein
MLALAILPLPLNHRDLTEEVPGLCLDHQRLPWVPFHWRALTNPDGVSITETFQLSSGGVYYSVQSTRVCSRNTLS